MATIVFRKLIDAAIGSPDPGHVDFYALQCVLYHFADKLNILDCVVDNTKFRGLFNIKKKANRRHSKCLITSAPSRLFAGSDVEDTNVAIDDEPIADEDPNVEPEPVNETEIAEMEQLDPKVEENAESEPEIEPELPASEVVVEQVEEPETTIAPKVVSETLPPSQDQVPIIAFQPSSLKEPPILEETRHVTSKDTSLESIKSANGKVQYLYEPISDDLLMGISIMKDQIELAMEQINMIINMELSGRRKSLVSNLKDLNRKMRHIQRANFYIESKSKVWEQDYTLDEILDDGIEGMEESEAAEVEEMEYPKVNSIAKGERETFSERPVKPSLEYHLCYTPERIMDDLLDLKTEFCHLTNKVNDLMAALEEIDSQRTKIILSELQDHLRDVRYIVTVLKDGQELLNKKQKVNTEKIVELDKIVLSLRLNKVDKSDMELALAQKVDYELLERKVSHDQLKEALCRIEKQFCETQRLINFNEKHALQVIDNMRKNLGLDSIDQMLKAFRDKVDQDIEKLQSILQNYIDSTNDECAAAGARVQVLKDLACISCDTQCVMRTIEKSKVGKLRNAHATSGLGPLITYELGAIRKSGIMGYYRKDEFPHAPNTWMNRKNVALNMCLPRHSGGEHTTNTAKEIIHKVVKRSK